MAKKKKPTQLQLEYRKQVKRLKQAVRRAEKRGYIIPDNIIPEQPKRITRKSVERLKKITTEEIYKKSEKLDFETGELIPGEVARKQERNEAAKKAAKTRKNKTNKPVENTNTYYPTFRNKPVENTNTYYPTFSIIDVIRERIIELTREAKPDIPIEQRKNELLSIFDDTVTMYSDNITEYELYLKNNESEIADLLNVIIYDSDAEKVSYSFVRLGRLLNTQSLSPTQAEGLSLMSEYYNE